MNPFATTRRTLLGLLASLPGVKAVLPTGVAAAAASLSHTGRDVIQELGIRSFINAAGTFTFMTGSLMPPEVIAAIQVASRKYVRLEDLHEAVGKRIA